MQYNADELVRNVTSELNEETLREALGLGKKDEFRKVPHETNDPAHPCWRVRFDLAFDPAMRVGLDINGEVILGRGQDGIDFVGLFDPQEAELLGISRRHALIRPTESKLYVVDLESTNGTYLNGRSIGVNMPYSLSDGDRLMLGRLEVIVNILERPAHHKTGAISASLSEAMPPIARAITSQLDVKDVLKQAMEMAMRYTPADEITAWLVDEQTGELFLEAAQGTKQPQLQRLPVADTLPGRVIQTGKALRANRDAHGEKIKVKTGYLVEAVIYVPLTLGGVTFGVLSAAHREPGNMFNNRDEEVMTFIADIAALAIQNARLYQAANASLLRRTKLITALNYALSYDFKKLLNSSLGYAGLLESDANTENAAIAEQIIQAGNQMARLIDRLHEVTVLSERPSLHYSACDLVEIINQVLWDIQEFATTRSTHLEQRIVGEPCLVEGNTAHLYRSVLNLVDNAIRYSPPKARVEVSLVFGPEDILIRVCDTGPGIPKEDLPHLFEMYFRGTPQSDGQAGLGLGLEFVRATAEAHRGKVTAHNVEGKGAEFIITLPGSLRVL